MRLAELLLVKGARIEAKDKSGNTALILALKFRQSAFDVPALTVGPFGFANGSAPVINAANGHRYESRRVR